MDEGLKYPMGLHYGLSVLVSILPKMDEGLKSDVVTGEYSPERFQSYLKWMRV